MDRNYGHGIDWWAFGVLIYEFAVFRPPFRGEDEDEIYDAILMGEMTFPSQITPQTISIISGLLAPDPIFRLGSGPDGAEDVMQHEWFKGMD